MSEFSHGEPQVNDAPDKRRYPLRTRVAAVVTAAAAMFTTGALGEGGATKLPSDCNKTTGDNGENLKNCLTDVPHPNGMEAPRQQPEVPPTPAASPADFVLAHIQ